MIDAHAHPASVAGDVVDAIRNRTPEFRYDEVVHANLLGRALRLPFAPGILEIADEFLLLRVDRDGRIAGRQRLLDAIVDVVELPVAIGMIGSLARLAVGLKRIVELMQQLADEGAADRMAHVAQPLAELAQALAGPQQRRLRVATGRGLDQGAQVLDQAGIARHLRSAASAGPADALRVDRLAAAQFGERATDRAARQPGRSGHRRDAAMPRGERLGGGKSAPPALIEHRIERLETLANGRFVNHSSRL